MEGRPIRVKKSMRQQKNPDRVDVASGTTDAEIENMTSAFHNLSMPRSLKVSNDVLQPLIHWSSTLTSNIQQRHKAGANYNMRTHE